MTRDAIESILNGIYASRKANDVAQILSYFAPDAVYRIAGDARVCPVAAAHRGGALRETVSMLCEAFPATEFAPRRIVVDGDTAMSWVALSVVFARTGEKIDSELAHVWTFRDGKVAELVEFLDTALVAQLHQSLANPPT